MSETNPRTQRAQDLFKKGNEAAHSSNFDYAIQMYQDACKLDPENLIYRQALRGIERRKFNNDPKKVSRMVGVKNKPIRARAGMAKATRRSTGTPAAMGFPIVNMSGERPCARV